MAGEAMGTCLVLMCCVCLLLAWQSFSTLAPTEMGLWYNSWLQTIDTEPVITGGMKFRPFNTLIRYPKTVQTIQYTAEHRDLLDGRTSDGLPLILGVSFQYQLRADGDHLYQLYSAYEQNVGDYEQVFFLVGIHIITELATNFTAYQFFNSKQNITLAIKDSLDEYFQDNLHANVLSVQISEDDLPQEFTDVVLEAATCSQNISAMTNYKAAQEVKFNTNRIEAEYQANVTVAKAQGDAARVIALAQADAAIIEAYVTAERTAYSKIREDLALEGKNLLDYIWYDSLGGGGFGQDNSSEADTSVLVGVNPAAYISR